MSEASETRIKAAFLYKFGGYIEWPAEAFVGPNAPLIIGVIGADAIADELNQLVVGRTLQNRPIMVKRLRRGDNLAGVHVLFVGAEESRWRELLDQVRGQPILTVTEAQPGGTQPSIVNFVLSEDRVRFDVSLGAAQRNHLRVGAQLLSVAREVHGGPQ